ncbi:helix-turn-helix domain-containing protein [Ectopseudomonas mendocina]|uniref:Helix-turn-helix domain-containing protein n=1 Tax=Ectopseudomonas mendocina TaxID=300 RepID=A0A379IT58_ECTME|nr:DNA-binding protein [Pseudomonas mendocina]SUD39497.1 helix-turn-helix domain-containing protein [Pseudomonas mendocina]
MDYIHGHSANNISWIMSLYIVQTMINCYQMTITDRAIQLIGQSNLSELTRAGETDYNRWVSIKRGRARVGAEEIEILGKVYPQYRWWISTGEVLPEIGQTSPEYDEANRNLTDQNAG